VHLPIFRKAQKRIFVNSNANILQSTWWKILNFYHMCHHSTKSSYYKILWIYVPKNVFFPFFLVVLKMAIFECFGGKHSQGKSGASRGPLHSPPRTPNLSFFFLREFFSLHLLTLSVRLSDVSTVHRTSWSI